MKNWDVVVFHAAAILAGCLIWGIAIYAVLLVVKVYAGMIVGNL